MKVTPAEMGEDRDFGSLSSFFSDILSLFKLDMLRYGGKMAFVKDPAMKSTRVIVNLTWIFGLLSAAIIVYAESPAGQRDSISSTVLFVLWNASGIVLFGGAIYVPVHEWFRARRFDGMHLTTREVVRIDDEMGTSESVER